MTVHPVPSARPLVALMVGAIVGVAALAGWDEQREARAALDDLATEQAVVASSVATFFSARLEDASREGRAVRLSELEQDLARNERLGEMRLVVAAPGATSFATLDGRPVVVPSLEQAAAIGRPTTMLPRDEASHLGLTQRTAVAGLARVLDTKGGRWTIAAVTSAERERDRERRARTRLVLAVVVAGGLVLTFGGRALQQQRQELTLSRELAVAEIARERDERLERMGKAATMVTLASGVAHELSTPLGVIVGRAEQVAARVKDDATASRSVRAILDEAEHMNRVIRGFLGLARGALPALESVAPGAVIDGARALVEHRFAEAGVSLTVKVPPNLPPLRCDARLLEHALVNLLLNACDACVAGGSVEVRATADATSADFVVTDDGSGIAPAVIERVTEPFFSTKPLGKGSGLGLAITNEIVKSHRGRLTLTPAKPHGTQASLHLPLGSGGDDART